MSEQQALAKTNRQMDRNYTEAEVEALVAAMPDVSDFDCRYLERLDENRFAAGLPSIFAPQHTVEMPTYDVDDDDDSLREDSAE